MKKLYFLFISFSLVASLPLHAQNYLKPGRSALKAVSVKNVSKITATNVQSKGLSSAVRTAGSVASVKTTSFSAPSIKAVSSIKGGSSRASASNARAAAPRIDQAALERTIKNRQQAPSFIAPDEHIFQAVARFDSSVRFSGTVFSVNYKGKKEIYGAVATHIVPTEENDPLGVGRQFTAIVYHNGRPVQIPAQIVASSPVSMLDISLVKFPAEAEAILKPFSIGEANEKETLRTIGFVSGRFNYIPNRKVIQNLPFSIRTTMPLPRDKRSGLCGSPLLNENNELVAIHTGSTFNPSNDYSFATPAHYLRDLVDAYHNKGISKIAFYVDDGISIRLNSDEYVTSVMLLDDFGHALAEEDVAFRFSHSKVSTMLRQYPQAGFLKLTTKAVKWSEDGSALLVKRSWLDETPSKAYFYDLKDDKLLSVTEE